MRLLNRQHRYWLIHRADYQRLLYDGAREAGAKILFSRPVKSVDPDVPNITFKDGSRLAADLIVGADGLITEFLSNLAGCRI